MNLLAIDTATRSCSVAVTNKGSLSAELTIVRSQTHSKHLMELIHSVLEIAGFHVADLDGLAVTMGPGSFTGLRIGISTIKGLAYALARPVVGISTLEALAWQCGQTSYLICPLLDARKGEVYGATYGFNEGRLIQMTGPRAMVPEDVVEHIKSPCVFIGNGARLYRRDIVASIGGLAHFVPEGQNMIRASSVAFLSMPRFEANDTDAVAGLVPHYIRKSDAELNFGP
ncbi:MAG: tRNA (adenosine(37)-N6)-threonylcarbamoyltransferase complex dimerization subunit type 1 TsaB [Deltaproteobacteria bacterium]|jgi:tRNA threonylcarbamoyladenosine biosynthesis protein TsaB